MPRSRPRRRPDSLSKAQARRIALAAQGFLDPTHHPPTMRTFARTLERTGVLQIDTVNVLARAHYMPLFSRMGAYDVDLLHRAAERRPRRVVEYWAHVAAFMPVELWPVMQFRMDRSRERGREFAGSNPRLVADVLAQVRDRGASSPRDLDPGLPRSRENWGWNWSQTQHALDHLFGIGELAVAGRTTAFERIFDLPERVLPAHVLAAPPLRASEAAVELVRRAARSHGVATEACLRDYYRMSKEQTGPAVQSLVEAGELLPVEVEGWDRPAYLHHQARVPRRIAARTVLSPFDPVVWERARTEALFDFHYRIEIYVPAHKRVHGYYVLPFLLGDQIVARLDLKADRAAGVLRVQASHREPRAPSTVADEVAAHLVDLSTWLGLDAVQIAPRGDLAPALAAASAAAPL